MDIWARTNSKAQLEAHTSQTWTQSMRRIFLLSSFIFLLSVIANIIFYLPDDVDTEAMIAAAQQYQVRIIRDEFGVPHIYGKRDVDTAFGLAYAHAEDDYQTIEDVILATRGTLAAVKGVDAAKTDYLIQMMRVWEAVDQGYDTQINQQTRDIAQAYADGINLYAAQHPQHTSNFALPVTGKDLIAGFTFKLPLFYGFDKVLGEVLDPETPRQLAVQGDNALQFTQQVQPELGSQGVAIAPFLSADGKTRLLVNSHQPLSGPVAWYEARVVSEQGLDMAGSTFPGSPIILHGHNRFLGWSNTVNKPDLVDVYRLTLNPENDNQYLLDGEWHDFEQRNANILVKLLGPIRWTFKRPLFFSAHGPVFKLDHGTFALRWAGMGEMRTLEQYLALNKATNKAEFEAALAMGTQPSINYVYADGQGNIAHYYNAMFPKRQAGWDWQKDLPGDRSDLIWQDYLPFEAIPKTVNPPSGFVFNANNTPFVSSVGEGQPKSEDFAPNLGIETNMTNRAHRLRRLLSNLESVSDSDFRNIKYDLSYDLESQGMLAFLRFIEAPLPSGNDDIADAFALLKKWDYQTNVSNRSAAIAMLTLAPLLDFRQYQDKPDLIKGLRDAKQTLVTHFGRIDPEYGEMNRLKRGQQEWPLDGGPDTLRAIYSEFDTDTGKQIAVTGDSYIMFVDWDEKGKVSSSSVHNFGSATLDKDSPHFDNQAPIFAKMQEKPVRLDLADVLKHATRDYSPLDQ